MPTDFSKKFMGYRRENGRVGVRNHVVILPVDDISNAAAEAVVPPVFLQVGEEQTADGQTPAAPPLRAKVDLALRRVEPPDALQRCRAKRGWDALQVRHNELLPA